MCDKCSQFPHLIQSIRNLSPELQSVFPVPGTHAESATGQVKRRKIQVTAHYISGDDMYLQMKKSVKATCSVNASKTLKKKAICKAKNQRF